MKDKISDDENKSIDEVISKLKTAINEKKYDDVDAFMKELQEKWYPIAQKAYQQNNAAASTKSPTDNSQQEPDEQ